MFTYDMYDVYDICLFTEIINTNNDRVINKAGSVKQLDVAQE